jgi:hypothetical protein
MSQINKIAVIGAGNMGSGIAQKLAQENVILVDMTEEFVERGIHTIRQTLNEAVERKILNAEQVHDALSRIIGTCDFEMVAEADLVIEAVFVLKIWIRSAPKRPFWQPTLPVFTFMNLPKKPPDRIALWGCIISITRLKIVCWKSYRMKKPAPKPLKNRF